jgi:hypothetical protein
MRVGEAERAPALGGQRVERARHPHRRGLEQRDGVVARDGRPAAGWLGRLELVGDRRGDLDPTASRRSPRAAAAPATSPDITPAKRVVTARRATRSARASTRRSPSARRLRRSRRAAAPRAARSRRRTTPAGGARARQVLIGLIPSMASIRVLIDQFLIHLILGSSGRLTGRRRTTAAACRASCAARARPRGSSGSSSR